MRKAYSDSGDNAATDAVPVMTKAARPQLPQMSCADWLAATKKSKLLVGSMRSLVHGDTRNRNADEWASLYAKLVATR